MLHNARIVDTLDEALDGVTHLCATAMVRFAVRYEYARTVEDVLARRSRLLFLDAALARTLAPAVARLLLQENGVEAKLPEFLALCDQYLSLPS